jgi:hypothetical protein
MTITNIFIIVLLFFTGFNRVGTDIDSLTQGPDEHMYFEQRFRRFEITDYEKRAIFFSGALTFQ